MTRVRVLSLVALVVSVVAAACGGEQPTADPAAGTDPAPGPDAASGLAVAVASYDLAVGGDQRFIAGVLTHDHGLIGGGQVQMAFAYLGEGGAEPQAVATTTASFLAVPGKGPSGPLDGPTVVDDPEVAGVYGTRTSFDRAGFWQVTVTADVDGEQRTGTGAFQVLQEHQVVTVGDPAPRTDSPTISSELPAVAIDSRAGPQGEVPDPELHGVSIAQALDEGRPLVVVVSTPVYCASRFCGPITDHVQDLAGRYADRAAFVHLEVWRDFEAAQLNDAAAAWIATPDGGGNEPWVFLVDADGRIAARWDNVLDAAELEQLLEDMPADLETS